MTDTSQPAQTHAENRFAPSWLKLMLVAVAVIATLQLVKDLGGFNFNWSGLTSVTTISTIRQVLGAQSSEGRLTAIYDNYNMCQNKLGLDYGIVTNGQVFGAGDLAQDEATMKQLYAVGMRYVQVNVQNTDSADIINVAEIIKLAQGNHLTPIIVLTNNNGSNVEERANIIANFYKGINDQPGMQGKQFIASTAPGSAGSGSNITWEQRSAIAMSVADKLADRTDITLATPLLKVYEPDYQADESSASIVKAKALDGTYVKDEYVGSRQDEVKTFQKVGTDLRKFEIVLVGIKNYDKDFGELYPDDPGNGVVSQEQRRGYYVYKELPLDPIANTLFKAGHWIRETNDSTHLNIRAIVMDFGPGADFNKVETNKGSMVRERLAYDYGSFADDPSVQAVIFGRSVADTIISRTDNLTPTPDTSTADNVCKVGVNFANYAGFKDSEAAMSKADEIGYGYGLVIINSPSEAGNATAAANSLCNLGMVPIIRSCVTGSCDFTSGEQQAQTYVNIINGANICAERNKAPYVLCGHNEVESEFDNKFLQEGQWSHACLNGVSSLGSKVKVISTVFNATHPDLENQVAAWRSGFGSNLAGLACIGLNTYSIIDTGGTTPAIDWYNRLFNLAPFVGSDIKGCVTETGVISRVPSGDLGKSPTAAIQAIRPLLEKGAVFALGFNFMGTNQGFDGFHLTDDGRSLTRALCDVGPTNTSPTVIANTSKLADYFNFVGSYGNNCDYDTVSVAQSFSTNSKAIACDNVNAVTSGKTAQTKILCSSPDSCTGTVKYTVQVGLPIRSFGSNSVVGTQTHPYEPYSLNVDSSVSLSQYDLLNQYASNLTSGSGDYAMPWLGNALFNAGNIAKFQVPEILSAYDKTTYDSEGAFRTQTIAEEKTALDSGRWVWGYNSNPLVGAVKIPLERALCIGNLCFDKYLGPADTYAGFSYYDPDRMTSTTKLVAACNGAVKRVDADPQNMVYGTEQVVKTDTWTGTGAQLCYENWLPDDRISGDGLSCSLINNNDPDGCACLESSLQRPLGINELNVRSGICHARSADQINRCIKYNSGADAYTATTVKLKSDLPSIPVYDVPGAYDALANLYRIVQAQFSKQNLKMIFNELPYSGWESDVILKAYSETPNSDHEVQAPRTNNMLENISTQTATGTDNSKFYPQYNHYLAEGDNFQKANQYYEALGMIDELTKIMALLQNQAGLPGGQLVLAADGDNVYFKTGEAEMFAGFFGCDDRLNFELESDVGHKLNCLAPYTDRDSEQYVVDPLAAFLCKKGYGIVGECDAAMCTPPEVDDIPTTITGKYPGVTCPWQTPHTCYQGPYGASTHCQYQELALDLVSLKPSNPSERDRDVHAPESGSVAANPHPGEVGWTVEFKGDTTGIVYQITHLEQSSIPPLGTHLQVGQLLAQTCLNCYSYDSWHIHVKATYAGRSIDPYLVYGEALGCSVTRPTTDMKYADPVSSNYCHYVANGVNHLNDNYPFYCEYVNKERVNTGARSIPDPNQMDNAAAIALFDKLKSTTTTNTITSQPEVQGATTGGSTVIGRTTPYCGNACALLPLNGVAYPNCPTTDYSLAGNDYFNLIPVFGGNDPGNGVDCNARAQVIGASVPKASINFLGFTMTVHAKLPEKFAAVEKDIESLAASFDKTTHTYNFPSGSYTFDFDGSYNPREVRILPGENRSVCKVSPHTWAVAVDFNSAKNPNQGAGVCSNDKQPQINMPPEVVWAFEHNGFRWGGHFGPGYNIDPMHFEYVAAGDVDQSVPPPVGIANSNNLCPILSNDGSNIGTGEVTREKILKLCSPRTITYVDISAEAIRKAYQAVANKPNTDLTRIQQILDEAKARNLNAAFLFGFWLTEGGFRGDNIAGATLSSPNTVGFDFGCGVAPRCGISERLAAPASQELTNQRFISSLKCAAQTNSGCNLMCQYTGITQKEAFVVQGYGTQQPGIGGFLECYGPIADSNPNFAKGFIRMYDTLFPPGTEHGRVNDGQCVMSL